MSMSVIFIMVFVASTALTLKVVTAALVPRATSSLRNMTGVRLQVRKLTDPFYLPTMSGRTPCSSVLCVSSVIKKSPITGCVVF